MWLHGEHWVKGPGTRVCARLRVPPPVTLFPSLSLHLPHLLAPESNSRRGDWGGRVRAMLSANRGRSGHQLLFYLAQQEGLSLFFTFKKLYMKTMLNLLELYAYHLCT